MDFIIEIDHRSSFCICHVIFCILGYYFDGHSVVDNYTKLQTVQHVNPKLKKS